MRMGRAPSAHNLIRLAASLPHGMRVGAKFAVSSHQKSQMQCMHAVSPGVGVTRGYQLAKAAALDNKKTGPFAL
jgi:hypothetical protein